MLTIGYIGNGKSKNKYHPPWKDWMKVFTHIDAMKHGGYTTMNKWKSTRIIILFVHYN